MPDYLLIIIARGSSGSSERPRVVILKISLLIPDSNLDQPLAHQPQPNIQEKNSDQLLNHKIKFKDALKKIIT